MPVTRKIEVSHMPLNAARDWRDISGSYDHAPDSLEASIRINGSWHPVDAPRVKIQRLLGSKFRVTCSLRLHLEVWGSGYRDMNYDLDFEAKFIGLTFQSNELKERSECDAKAMAESIVSRYAERASYGPLSLTHEVMVDCPPINS